MSEEKNINHEPEGNNNAEDGNENASQELTIEQSKTQSENMEVHHHPHVEKKNFKEYFLEFLMIFLAVTMGFFAESLREHVSDNSKEKEYVASIIEDMKKDSATLNNYIYISIPYHRKWIDSEIALLQQPSFAGKGKEIYQAFIVGNLWTYDFFKTGRTLSQLNTEGFRLIKSKEVIGAITDWET